MYAQSWGQAFQQSFYGLSYGVINFLPSFLVAVIVFIVGWAIGLLLQNVIEQAIKAIHVDHALRGAGVERVVNRAGYNLNSGRFLGVLVKWFVIVVFFMFALQIMGLATVTFFLQQIVLGFLPNVIVAVLIVLVGAVVAEVAQGVVAGGARAAGIQGAGFAGMLAKWAIWVFAIIVALSQLGIASAYFQTLFTGVVVALSLAFGLAFGLGGQDAAAKFIDQTRNNLRDRM
jgi:hypothetical protein